MYKSPSLTILIEQKSCEMFVLVPPPHKYGDTVLHPTDIFLYVKFVGVCAIYFVYQDKHKH